MSTWLLTVVTVIYLAVGVSYVRHRQNGMGLVFFAYALANVGLIIDALGRRP